MAPSYGGIPSRLAREYTALQPSGRDAAPSIAHKQAPKHHYRAIARRNSRQQLTFIDGGRVALSCGILGRAGWAGGVRRPGDRGRRIGDRVGTELFYTALI